MDKQPPSARPRPAPRSWLFLTLAPLLIGCATYQVGSRTLYRPGIRTVHVPIFTSDSFRRQLGEQLTEVVVKEIELKTPYKVDCAADADSILRGRILYDAKRVRAEDNNDLPRNIDTELAVEIRWESRHGDLLRDSVVLPIPPVVRISQTANLIPEGGQSVATAHQRAIAQLAEQIVAQMEIAW